MLVLVIGLFCLSAAPATAGSLDSFSDMLGNLSDMARAADRAHDDYLDAMNGGRDYGRYERDWRQRESSLEREPGARHGTDGGRLRIAHSQYAAGWP